MKAQESLLPLTQVFITPADAPFKYHVSIAHTDDIAIEVTEVDTTAETKRRYIINPATHASYLDAFEQLSADFSFRLPQNRKLAVPPAGKIDYQEVLLDNKDAGMLYGYGDPAVLRTEQNGKPVYYLVATSNDAPDSFPILKSENLQNWTFVGYVFPHGQKPAWAADGELVSDYWAPEMHCVGNEYRVYFVARNKETRELCIGMARSVQPEGPFIPEDRPIIKGNVIDPHIYVQDKRTAYLFWKEDNNDVWPSALIELLYANPTLIPQLFAKPQDQATASFMISVWPWLQTLQPMERFMFIQVFIEAVIERFIEVYDTLERMASSQPEIIAHDIRSVLHYMKTPMFAQQLSADGQTLVDERIKVLENDLAWEAHLIEGMWVTRQQNRYYLFYAGNDFSTDQYGIGVAIAEHPLGPYRKVSQPFLQSTAQWTAPGHPSVTTGANGKPVMFLHAYFPGQAGYKQFRALLAVGLRFEADKVFWE